MNLHELTPDALLEQLAERQQVYVTAKHQADLASRHVDAVFAEMYLAIKSADKLSVEDAKQSAKGNPAYIQSWQAALEHAKARDEAMMNLERVRTAIDLWRSESANRRLV